MGHAICQAVDDLLKDQNLMRHFPVDIFQTGSGTSTNMNANEVLATLATKIYTQTVDANDHVNCGQSSNDIIPSTIHISAAIELSEQLLPALNHLASAIHNKAKTVDQYVKTGRTHLMDAMPVRMSQSLKGWATQIEQNIQRLQQLQPSLQSLAQERDLLLRLLQSRPI
jgi:fumarate hydratase, class II